MSERAQVGLQDGDRLPVTGHGQGQRRGRPGDQVTLHAHLEPIDRGLRRRLHGNRGVVPGHLHRGRQGDPLHPVLRVRGNKVCEDPVAAGRLPLPRDRPGALGVHLRVDVGEVLAVGAHHDQVQLLVVLHLEAGDRVAVRAGHRQRQRSSRAGLGRGTDRGEAVPVLGQAETGRIVGGGAGACVVAFVSAGGVHVVGVFLGHAVLVAFFCPCLHGRLRDDRARRGECHGEHGHQSRAIQAQPRRCPHVSS